MTMTLKRQNKFPSPKTPFRFSKLTFFDEKNWSNYEAILSQLQIVAMYNMRLWRVNIINLILVWPMHLWYLMQAYTEYIVQRPKIWKSAICESHNECLKATLKGKTNVLWFFYGADLKDPVEWRIKRWF